MKRIIIAILVLVMLSAVVFCEGQKEKKITIKVWDQWSIPTDVKAIDLIQDKFFKEYPNIQIDRTGMTTEQIKNLILPAVGSGTGPDIIYPEADVGILAPLVKAKALLDLTDVWKKQWDNKLFLMSKEFTLLGNRAWGIGNELEFSPIYYSKSLFKQLGVTPPTLISDLEKILDTAKNANYIPITWGGRTWWMVSNYATYVLWAYMGKAETDKATLIGGTWKVPAAYEGIRTAFVKWVDNNYYAKDAMSLSFEETMMLLSQKKTAIFPGANAFVPQMMEVPDQDFASFLWPVPKKGQRTNTVTFCGSMYVVNASTKYPKEAIAYLDFILGTEYAARTWYEVADRVPPYKKPIPGLKINPLVGETLDVLLKGDADLTPAHNTVAPPEAVSWMTDGIGKVFLKQITPEEFIDQLDAFWQKGREEGLTRDSMK